MFDEEHQKRRLRRLASWLHVIVCSLGRWSTTKRQNNIYKDVSAARCLKGRTEHCQSRQDRQVGISTSLPQKKKTKSNKNIVDVQLPALNINVCGSFQCSSVIKSMYLYNASCLLGDDILYVVHIYFFSMHHDLLVGWHFHPGWKIQEVIAGSPPHPQSSIFQHASQANVLP